MSALRYCAFFAVALSACVNEPVTALSSDVGSSDAANTSDAGAIDAVAPLDSGPLDAIIADSGQHDAGMPTDASPPDQGPPSCIFPDTEQVGPADLDEIPNPNDNASMVLRSGLDNETFVLAWEMEPGPRSDEPFPIVRHYPRRGVHFAEEGVYTMIPTRGLYDVRPGEPGFYHVLAKYGASVDSIGWNELGSVQERDLGVGGVFGVPAFSSTLEVYLPFHPSIRGASGRFESLSLIVANLNAGTSSTVGLTDGSWSLGFEEPRVAAGDGEIWIGSVRDYDFPPTPVAAIVDPIFGGTLETIYGESCEGQLDYELVIYNGNAAILSDCARGVGGTTTRMTLGRGSFRADQPILDTPFLAVPSRIAYDGSDLAVAVWEEGQLTPAIRFYSASGTPQSAGSIRLPTPSGITANDTPKALALTGFPGFLGGFSFQTAAWGVAFAYQTPAGVRTFFARVGPCGTQLPL
jgi:hypothetical protein